MKKSILSCLFFILLPFYSYYSYAIYFDPETLANDKARKELFQKLKKENKHKCNIKNINCSTLYSQEAREAYPLRGKSYAKHNYSDFTKKQAFKRLKELAVIYQKAENKSSTIKKEGVVYKDKILEEGWFLFKDILKFDTNEPRWRDFYADKQKRTMGFLPSPFIDENCNMLIESERKMQVRINKKCARIL